MHPWTYWWKPTSFGVLGIVAMTWMAPKATKMLGQGQAKEATHATFATLTAASHAELYLKDARAFIFSTTNSGQNLKLHDSVLVGPKSEANLVLSDEFGGGKIRLAANTIITLSRAGRRNEIPRIDIKQGEIKVLEAPRKPALQKNLPELAATDDVELSTDNTEQSKAISAVEVSALPGIIITSGESAIVFDEKIKSADLVAVTQSNSLEIKMPLAAQIAEPQNEPEQANAKNTEVMADATPSTPTVTPVLLAEIEEASATEEFKNESLSETVAKIQEAKLPPREPQAVQRAPATETIVEAVTKEPAPPLPITQAKAPVKTATKEEPKAKPQEEISKTTATTSQKPPQQDPPETTSIPKSEDTFFPLEISALLSQRSYPATSGSGKATDIDLGFKGENKILPNLNMAVIANIAVLNVKKPATGAPRPLSLSAEAKYQALKDKKLWLAAGYTYQTSSLSGSTSNYENIYAPHFGFDSTFHLGASHGEILFAPRFSIISSGSYWFTVPVTYYWNPRWGVGLNYFNLKVKADGKSEKLFQSFSSAIRWKF